MGTIQHHAIIITHYSREGISKFRDKALAIASETWGEGGWARLISPILPSPYNGYYTFFVAPDGSKEGWGPSEAGNEMRHSILRAARRAGMLEVVEVTYGEIGLGVETHDLRAFAHEDGCRQADVDLLDLEDEA